MLVNNPFSLSGKTILITGGAGGIGSATAVTCASLGARVVLTDIREDALTNTLALLPASLSGEKHQAFVADLTDENQINSLVDFCPVLDGLVCNAGVMKLTLTQFITEAELTRIQKINLNAPILLTRSLLKKKKINKGGSIVFLSSIDGTLNAHIGNSTYSATKGAIASIARGMAVELASKGIRVNCVMPGMTETPLIHSDSITQEQLDKDKKLYPLGRYGRPEEIAYGIIYLLSDASSFTTGAGLVIDGGFTLQ